MSGGGRDGGVPTGSPPSGECQEVYKGINLLSPNSEVLYRIKVGSELQFEVIQVGDNKSLRVVHDGDTAGSITKHAYEIINCIEQGNTYKAVITSLDGGSCVLEAVKIS